MQHQSLSYANRTGNPLPRAAYALELLRESHDRVDLPAKALRRAASPARPGSYLLRISHSLRAEAFHSPRGFSAWRTPIAETRDAAIGRIAIDGRVTRFGYCCSPRRKPTRTMKRFSSKRVRFSQELTTRSSKRRRTT